MSDDKGVSCPVAATEGGNPMSKRKNIVIISIVCVLLLLLLGGIIWLCFFGKGKTSAGKQEGNAQTITEENTQTPGEENNQTPGNENQETPDQGNVEQPNGDNEQKPEQNEQEDSSGSNNTGSEDDSNEEDPKEEEVTPPSDVTPPVVDIPVEDETVGLEFPCEVPGHDLRIEKLAPYSGIFVEDGTNSQVTDVAMLQVTNFGTTAVEYAEISVVYEDKTLVFHISALPAGESLVSQEASAQSVPEGTPTSATALVAHRTEMAFAEGVSVTDNGDNSLTIKNGSDTNMPTVRVFYKYYMAEEELFVGGIAFTLRLTNLAPGASITVRPSHYISETSRVVMVQTYESDI